MTFELVLSFKKIRTLVFHKIVGKFIQSFRKILQFDQFVMKIITNDDIFRIARNIYNLKKKIIGI